MKEYPVIHMVGGGTQSALLCQLTANACGGVQGMLLRYLVEATVYERVAIQLMAEGAVKGPVWKKPAERLLKASGRNPAGLTRRMENALGGKPYRNHCETHQGKWWRGSYVKETSSWLPFITGAIKVLCEMGHSDRVVIADWEFPGGIHGEKCQR